MRSSVFVLALWLAALAPGAARSVTLDTESSGKPRSGGPDGDDDSDEDTEIPPLGDEDVLDLKNGNIDTFLQQNKFALVEFYAPWCHHCLSLKPEYKKAAEVMRKEGSSIRFAQMDCVAETRGEAYKREGYPTVLYFVDGEEKEHIKLRDLTEAEVTGHMRKRENALLREIAEDEVDRFLASQTSAGSFTLLARVKSKSARAKAFMKAKEELHDLSPNGQLLLRLAVVWLGKDADAKGDASLLLHRPGFIAPDETRVEFKGSWTGGNIAKWVRTGLVGSITPFFHGDLWDQTLRNFEARSEVALVAAMLGKSSEHMRESVQSQLLEISKKFPGWNTMLLNRESLDKKKFEYFNPGGLDGPIVCIWDWVGSKMYVLPGHEFDGKANAIVDYAAKVKSKKARVWRKSEPAPKKPRDSDGIVTLVADTFDEVVLDPNKHVFVEYYTPDCEHCKELEAEWQKLAQEANKRGWTTRGQLVLAKINVAANEVDEEQNIVPKIVLYPAVKEDRKFSQRTTFTVSRTLEKMLNFLADLFDGAEEGEL